jgi:osmoprotectant transport system permease protein
VAFDALRGGDLDVYVDYTGTLWATILRREDPGVGRARVLEEVRRFLAEEHGVELVGALGFENTYALGLLEGRARELGVARIGQLASHAPRLEIGGDYEFFGRPEWASLRRVYGLRFRHERSMDAALMYQALAQGEVDVIGAYSTDGRIAALGIRLLEDERAVIPPYDAVILAGPRLARERPQALAALRGLAGAIDAAQMRRMNLAVDRDKRSPAAVAREFLMRLHGEG